uniref:CSON000030 protein n=1 Tax=Culicoides sonorensis TaxID=179676 RepID=A0A336MG95_CULSO
MFVAISGAFDIDVCETLGKNLTITGFAKLFRKSLDKNTPTLMHKCPYSGEEGFINGDVDKITGETLPQIVPTGFYKLQLRFHLKNNETFLNVFVYVFIDSTDPIKAMIMGKTQFCEKFIVPRTTAAGKYISLYRKIRDGGYYIHPISTTSAPTKTTTTKIINKNTGMENQIEL